MLRQYLRGDSLGRKYKSRYTPLMHWAYVAGAIILPDGVCPAHLRTGYTRRLRMERDLWEVPTYIVALNTHYAIHTTKYSTVVRQLTVDTTA